MANGSYANLFHVVNTRIFILKCGCRSKKEATRLLGGRLHCKGYVNKGVIDFVFLREDLASTSMVYTFAISYAYEGHVKKGDQPDDFKVSSHPG